MQLAATDSGSAVVVWVALVAGHYRIEAAVGSARARRWSRPAVLDSTTASNEAVLPQVAVDGRGDAAAVWMRIFAGSILQGQTDRVFASFMPRGGRWGRPVVLGTEVEPPGEASASSEFPGPRVAMDGAGDAVVVWQGRRDGAIVAVNALRRNGPRARWQSAAAISRVPGLDPHVALDSRGDATAIWVGAGNSIVTSSRHITGVRAWSAPNTLAHGDPSIFPYPQIAVNSAGESIAAWTGHAIMVAVRPAGTLSWQRPVGLSSGGSAQIAMNSRSDAIVVWQHPTARNILIASARYSPNGSP